MSRRPNRQRLANPPRGQLQGILRGASSELLVQLQVRARRAWCVAVDGSQSSVTCTVPVGVAQLHNRRRDFAFDAFGDQVVDGQRLRLKLTVWGARYREHVGR